MKKGKIAKTLLHTLVATVYTVPYAAHAMGSKKPEGETAKSKTEQASEAISQEVIQLLQEKEELGDYRLNIAGRPGVNYRVYYSPTGEEGSYQPLPEGEGTIGENGIAVVKFTASKLSEGDIYLQVFTSDKADFSEGVRVNAAPLVLALGEEKEKGELKLRGWLDRPYRVRTPNAVAAVRGRLPEQGPFKKSDAPK